MPEQHSRPEGAKGWNMASSKKASKDYGDDRYCQQPMCDTKLSRYNPGRFCSAHEGNRDAKEQSLDERSKGPRKP